MISDVLRVLILNLGCQFWHR